MWHCWLKGMSSSRCGLIERCVVVVLWACHNLVVGVILIGDKVLICGCGIASSWVWLI